MNCARTRSIISDAAFITHTRALAKREGAPALCLQMQLDTQESQFFVLFRSDNPAGCKYDPDKISFQSKRVMSGIQIVAGNGKYTSYQSGDDVTKEEKGTEGVYSAD